jgi:ABC-2 type transport system permease protein
VTRAERRRAAEEREILELLIPQDPYEEEDPRPSRRNGRHSHPDEAEVAPERASERVSAVVRVAEAPPPTPVVIQPEPAHPVLDRAGQGMHRREPRLLVEVRVIGMVVKRELKRYFRSKAKILAALVQPFFFLLIFGFGMKTIVSTTGGVNFEQYVFPGVMAMIVLSRALLSAVSIVQDSEHGFLREMLVAPASRVSIVVGAIIGGATISTMQAALLFLGAPVMGLYPAPATIAAVLGAAVLMGIEVTALGVALATIIRKPTSFQATTQAITYPMLVLSGALVPIGGLPGWLQDIAKFDIFAYPVDSLRRLMLHSDSSAAAKVQLTGLELLGHHLTVTDELAFSGACTVVFVLVAVWRFAKSN